MDFNDEIEKKKRKNREYMKKYWEEHPNYRKSQYERIKKWRQTKEGKEYSKNYREKLKIKNEI